MESAEILAELERRGARVQVIEGSRLWVAPRAVLDDEIRQAIRAHRDELVAALRPTGIQEPSPYELLCLDRRDAIERAQAGFAENGITPDLDLLEATVRLELKTVEWRRMDAAHFPQASRLLELLGAVYAGRMVAKVNEDGKVTIRRKESTT